MLETHKLSGDMNRPSLLIVDDDQLICDSLHLALSTEFDVHLAESRPQAITLLRQLTAPPQLALIDLGLPPQPHRPDEGFRLIAELITHFPQIKILVLSRQSEQSHARHARTLGAIDFITKPCAPDAIKQRLDLAQRVMPTPNHSQQLGIIGHSTAIEALCQQIALYAATPFPVLIEGESGSGKELIAAAIQKLSPNKKAPYLIFNCAAIAPNLLEPTLFGYAKGAFTGATNKKSGFFEDASTGTLFLDEIGELPLELQAKLLRILENGEFQRVGETQTQRSQARIIAASNRDLRQEVQAGNFRNDLYHRLSIFTIKAPPLRNMGADRLLLLEHFRNIYAAQAGQQPFILNQAAMEVWNSYSFPGNARELRNIVIRLVTKYPRQTVHAHQLEAELDIPGSPVIQTETQRVDHLDCHIRDFNARKDWGKRAQHALQQPEFSLDAVLLQQENYYIEAALMLADGSISEAAKLLGLNRTTLYSRLEALHKHKAKLASNRAHKN
mgnify:CR=1 FL=1